MRDVMLLIGGLADTGGGEAGAKTPLEAAKTPVLDALATNGILGLTRLVSETDVPTSTGTLLAALGYDPAAVAVSPGLAVAVGLGVDVAPGTEIAVLDLVTAGIDEGGREIVAGVGGAHLARAERAALAATLAEGLRAHRVTVHPGSQAAVVVGAGGFVPRRVAPWGAIGAPFDAPDSEADAALRRAAREIIQTAPVVRARRSGGAPAPTDVWVWGSGGPVPSLRAFPDSGIVLADEPTPAGVARLLGLESAPLGAPEDGGGWDVAVSAILAAVERHVVTVACVDAVDVFGERGDVAGKTAAIETLDGALIGPLRRGLEAHGGDWRLAILAGHVTNTTARRRTADPVPFVVYAVRPEHRSPHARRRFHERDARENGIFIPEGHGLMARLVRR